MHANQILDPIFHQVLDSCLNTPEFFIAINEIDIFESKNDVSVNVLATEEGKEKLYILRRAKFDNQRRTDDLLPTDKKRRGTML